MTSVQHDTGREGRVPRGFWAERLAEGWAWQFHTEKPGAALGGGELVHLREVDVEWSARAIARASDDGCFDELDALLANADRYSPEFVAEERSGLDEDCDHYRSLARAALGEAS